MNKDYSGRPRPNVLALRGPGSLAMHLDAPRSLAVSSRGREGNIIHGMSFSDCAVFIRCRGRPLGLDVCSAIAVPSNDSVTALSLGNHWF